MDRDAYIERVVVIEMVRQMGELLPPVGEAFLKQLQEEVQRYESENGIVFPSHSAQMP